MDIDWLVNLLMLVETGHFSKAAQRSHISQPAFSRRIQHLENWVGTPLLDRSNYPVRLTPAGEEFVLAARRALKDLENAKARIRQVYGLSNPSTVTFAVQHSISWSFYPSWLQEFEKTFEGIKTHLRADDLMSCLEDLEEDRADFVICYETEMDRQGNRSNQILSFAIGVDRLVPVSKPLPDGSPRFELDRPDNVPIPLLSFGDQAPLGRILERFLIKQGVGNVVRPIYSNSLGSTLRFKASQGEGLAWLPESLVDGDLGSGNLVVAGSKKWEVKLSIVLLRLPNPLRNFIEKIWERIAEG